MLSVFRYLIRMGVSLGIVLLNAGIMMWLVGRIRGNRNASRLAGEIVKASAVLVALAFLVYIW